MIEWHKVEDRLPESRNKYRQILVLVNGYPQICIAMKKSSVFVYIVDNRFLYLPGEGFIQDERFAKPTHWAEIGELPND